MKKLHFKKGSKGLFIMLFLALINFFSFVHGQNLALNKPVTAFTVEYDNPLRAAVYAVDGNPDTRWASKYTDPQWITIDLQDSYNITQVVLKWEGAAGKTYQIEVSQDSSSWDTIYSTTTGAGGTEILNITGTGRYIRMYGTERLTEYGYSLWEFEVYGTINVTGVTISPATLPFISDTGTTQLTATVLPSNATNKAVIWTTSNSKVATVNSSGLVTGISPGNTIITATTADGGKTASLYITVLTTSPNIALNKPVYESSKDGSGDFPPPKAVDGIDASTDSTSRWGSLWSDPQYIEVDLQVPYNITQVVLKWEDACAEAYTVEVSYNDADWDTIYSTTTGTGGTVTIDNITATGRYIRMYGTKRHPVNGNIWGYSLYEFEVYGTVADYVPVTGLTMSSESESMLARGHMELTATVSPVNATHNDIIWTTSNPTVAIVDIAEYSHVSSKAHVRALTPGNATITAMAADGGLSDTASVTVTPVAVTGVSLPPVTPVYVSGSIQLTPIITPANATNRTVSWNSSNPSIATVDASGKVIGLAAGSTLITVTTKDGGFTTNSTYNVSVAPYGKFKVGVTLSSEYKPADTLWWDANQTYSGYKLSAQDSLSITEKIEDSRTTFNVNPDSTYQTIYGFGSSFEESSVYNLRLLSQEKRTEVLQLLLDTVNGSGLNLWRLAIGSSDYTGCDWYTYDDNETDTSNTSSLNNFSIQKDKEYGIIQVINEAQAINPNIRFIAAAWSAPAWMKTSGNLCGGYLKEGMCQVLAKYYRMFVQAYATEGIPIYAISLQNEPLQMLESYPTMGLSVKQEIELAQAIKLEFNKYDITTQIWIHDYNFEKVSFAEEILIDPDAYAATNGSAFHDYGGDLRVMTDLHTIYPDKEIFFTERSFWGVSGMDKIANYLRNWACSYNAWVTMLDQNKEPRNTPFDVDPTFLIKGSGDSYWTTPEVYLLGQYAKFVKFGAKRIKSELKSGGLTNIAFKNPDGSIAMVVMNNDSLPKEFKVRCEENQYIAELPGKTVGTYTWQSGLPPCQDYILHMEHVPVDTVPSPYNLSGAAAARMVLSYIANGDTVPSVTDIHASGGAQPNDPSTAINLGTAMHNLQPSPYTYYAGQFSNQAFADAYIAKWISCDISLYRSLTSGQKHNVPGLVPLYGSYTHWAVVNGVHASDDPFDGARILYGFWITTLTQATTGEESYVTIQDFNSVYSAINGKWENVLEPPIEDDGNLSIPVFYQQPALSSKKATGSIGSMAIEVVKDYPGLMDQDPIKDFITSCKTGDPLVVSNLMTNGSYYIVPFNRNGLTSAVVLVNSEGYYLEQLTVFNNSTEYRVASKEDVIASVLEKAGKDAVVIDAKLVYHPSVCRSKNVPAWQIKTDKGSYFVNDKLEAVSASITNQVPSSVSVQNSPNPMKDYTKFTYTLNSDGPVKLKIYNVYGQLVKVLVDENQTAGNHEVTWNGADSRGLVLRPGSYIYQIETNNSRDSKILIKN